MPNVRTLAASILLFLLCHVSHAATYAVPSDDELIAASRSIVVGTVIDSYPRHAPNGMIETITKVLIDEVLKGATESSSVSVAHWGGHLGNEWLAQSGAPEFVLGERVLLFLDQDARGAWTTYGLALGSFHFAHDSAGSTTLNRSVESNGNDSSHIERPRLEQPFLDYIRAAVGGERARGIYVAPEPLAASATFKLRPDATFPSGSYTSRFNGHPDVPIRRFGSALDVEWQLIGTQGSLDLAASVDFSLPKWNAQSSATFSRSATPATGSTVASDSESRIVANDPNGVVSGACCPGVVATAFQFGSTADQTFNGETFYRITHSDIVVNNGVDSGFGQGKLNTAMAHEVGHTLGLRHADQSNTNGACAPPLDCCVSGCSAVMKASTNSALAELQTWDKNAIKCVDNAVCPESDACTPPSISTHPVNKTITPPSTSTSLSVTANGTAPLTYQWFIGDSGDTSTPTGTGGSSISVSPTSTTNYWVRVTGQCTPVANSNTATVTVAPCAPPQISSFSNDRTITSGNSTQLAVNATGTAPLHYQWYIGAVGNTSQPTGNDSRLLTVSPTTTTSYWVRVSGACAPTADSEAVVVTVVACPDVVVATPTATPSGGSATLNVDASSTGAGPLSYAWFLGNTPGVGGTQVGNAQSTSVVITSDVRNYWARVTNSCGRSSVSSLVAVASCTLPGIETQPADQSILTGTGAIVSLVLTGDGNGVTVTWYRGIAPDKTTQIGTGNSVNVGPLTETTSYWAAVRNTCGEISTRTAIITIIECTGPAITVPPLSQEVPINTAASLSVTATGTAPLQYQWYEGAKGDTTKPVPDATTATLTSENLLDATSFWVRVTNACGTADSEAAVITVSNGRRRSVRK